MSKTISLVDFIKKNEYYLAKQKAVLEQFPDAKIHPKSGYSSKLVNKNYTEFEFKMKYRSLYVMPYCEIQTDIDGVKETIRIHSTPKFNRLAYITWDSDLRAQILKFSRLTFNLKNNQFKDDMLNACREEIMKFVQTYPNIKLDTKHLEPRLKKLLIFN